MTNSDIESRRKIYQSDEHGYGQQSVDIEEHPQNEADRNDNEACERDHFAPPPTGIGERRLSPNLR